jgi:hypothetical protein
MSRRRPRAQLREPESLDRVFVRAGEHRFARVRPVISPLAWRALVGARIADRTVPQRIEFQTLTITAATSTWAHELTLLSATILERLQTAGYDVQKIVVRSGHVEPPGRPLERRRSKKVPPKVALGEKLTHEIEQVEDPELAALLRDSAEQNLAWQKASENVATSTPRGATVPPAVETRTGPPGRSSPRTPAASRRTPEGGERPPTRPSPSRNTSRR